MEQKSYDDLAERSIAVRDSQEFQNLKRSFMRFIAPMSVIFLVWYVIYIVLASYAPGFFGIKVFGLINVALLFGLAQVATTFIITTLYRRWADKKYDPLATTLGERMESGALLADEERAASESNKDGAA
ncbi:MULTISPECIES: DUF485 domain-containing protein [Micrococcaceae]|uniref:Uncharacterized membrane protein (DUF485 family) n=1 Tax=Pseudoglutamicibacter albus TaxID=98671 RepID=A0ABU1YXJ4_9MICC|nr:MULTISPECIES: DUF485 domain-containing protein [Micrococcaceae]MCG7304386.1 DUF485 domain-containing protein [Pseudoglutamicibacter albus]MDR7293075.1 uncharacterized membrane protein (DUF485 family) [Pseudoglutamicibacter albus]OFT24460.1 hypothetical protein HMPREF3175_00165 [Arthrobacter sp. HMSC08H08]OFT41935.1 hypothetical protein HMPREF3160_06215 [Arthrobacter sp. HMSC06H05]